MTVTLFQQAPPSQQQQSLSPLPGLYHLDPEIRHLPTAPSGDMLRLETAWASSMHSTITVAQT